MTFLCNDISGCPVPSVLHPYSLTIDKLKEDIGWPADGIMGLTSFKVTGVVLAYYLFSMILYRVLPGEEAAGTPLPSGGRLKYKFNSISFKGSLIKASCLQLHSFLIFSIYDRSLHRRYRSSRRRLPCLDFHLGQLPPNTDDKRTHFVCAGNLRLYKEFRREARQCGKA